MKNLIDGILLYSRTGHTDLSTSLVDTKILLEEILDSLQPDNQFKIILNGDFPTFYTPRLSLSQVLSNLISNSIKHHNQATGNIEIGVQETELHFYKFYVADDGPGIESIYFDKIFQMFQTLKSNNELESSGIGLSIVKKIVESQRGTIVVQSTLGKGTTFYFTWPKYPLNNPLQDPE
ncbi:sensor histidine kinase [Legionella sp. WA2022007384]